MKAIVSMLLVAAMLILFSGCMPAGEAPTQDAAEQELPGEAGIVQEPEDGSETETQAGSEESGETAAVENPENEGTGIVAESSNPVSSEEKEAVLIELDKELEELLDSIDSLETVKDADLEIE